MRILVTGAKGFIGRNLVVELNNRKHEDILAYDADTDPALLDAYARECEFVFHLAGVNRPDDQEAFMTGNFGFTGTLLGCLRRNGNKAPVLFTSSIHAASDNPYGRSKRAAEDLLFSYGLETGAKVLVYRLPNVFGKWCRPNYNSAIATFCNNVTRDLPIQVNDRNSVLNLVYIDDVVEELVNAMSNGESKAGAFCVVPTVYAVGLGRIADLIQAFRQSRSNLDIADMSDPFTRSLYATYLSYLPKDQFSYLLRMNVDGRGSFTEVIRTVDRGQFSVNVTRPGITKGNHWHHTKSEKFLVVSGQGLVQFRAIDSDEVVEYRVSGDKMEVLDIPPGYTHSLVNVGDTDLVTLMWASEAFDPDQPDTYLRKV